MEYGLGIDAGGTYTDAVIVDFSSQQVLAKAKALTTRDDYSRGVGAAVAQLPPALLLQVQLVSLSTTLATNAIVEGKGGVVGVLALGFDDYDLAAVAHHPIRAVPGRINIAGQVAEALDEDAARRAIRELLEVEQVDALAISGMVSVRNPIHERRVREIASEMTEKPLVCAHELSMQLDSIKRTVTTALNARLLPIIAALIRDVKAVMQARGIHAPLMVVRGDGTLMSEEMARRTPVETILSGPAASVCGAQFLSDVQDGLVVDIGGTTSDIALLIDGNPVVAAKGARVGEWSTNVRAIDIETVGLGGDSAVTLTREHRVLIGPRRAIPLAYLAAEYPQLLQELARLWDNRESQSALIQPVECFVRVKSPAMHLTGGEARTLAALADGPLSREQLADRTGAMDPSLVPVGRLETLGCVQRSTLTPTDIMHVQGTFNAWSREAAVMGLRLYAHRAGVAEETLSAFILDAFSYWLTVHLMHRLIRHQFPVPDFPHGQADRALLDMLADGSNIQGLTLQAHFDNPLVAIGAPAAALAAEGARKFGARLVVPEHAEVANAVGAITGTVTLLVEATITPHDNVYIAHSPREMRTFTSLEAAREWAGTHLLALLEERIALGQVEGFHYHREVHTLDHNGATTSGAVFLECKVRATAVGKPEFAAFAQV